MESFPLHLPRVLTIYHLCMTRISRSGSLIIVWHRGRVIAVLRSSRTQFNWRRWIIVLSQPSNTLKPHV